MHPNLQEFNNKFQVEALKVCSSNYWNWSVRPAQCTLGAGILSLKRYAESFSQITTEESQDLQTIVSVIEKTLKQVFEHEKINYLMLMMVDPHVHFHIIPRYSKTITMYEKSWTDQGWPSVPILNSEITDRPLLHNIRETLRKSI